MEVKSSEINNSIIRITAVLAIIYGVGLYISDLRLGLLFIELYCRQDSFLLEEAVFHVFLNVVFCIILPGMLICAGIGLLKRKKWGWILSVASALIIFTARSIGIINKLARDYYYRDVNVELMMEAKKTVIGHYVIGYYSMMPVYISFVISLAVILFMRSKTVKNLFYKSAKV
ncbi:MAG: hypothetical protein ACYTFY_20185 [Planctomycetota bacterium]